VLLHLVQVLGNVKGVVAVVVSVLWFRNPISLYGMLGYGVTVGGVVAYSQVRVQSLWSLRFIIIPLAFHNLNMRARRGLAALSQDFVSKAPASRASSACDTLCIVAFGLSCVLRVRRLKGGRQPTARRRSRRRWSPAGMLQKTKRRRWCGSKT